MAARQAELAACRYPRRAAAWVGVVALAVGLWAWQHVGATRGGPQALVAFPGSWLSGTAVAVQVVAHSNHPLDQAAKLAVRDAVLAVLERGCPQWADGCARQLEQAARAALQYGPWPPYGVRVRIERHAPQAAAVRVLVGSAGGYNWWCVAFPLLCPGVRPEPGRAAAHRDPQASASAANPGMGEVSGVALQPAGEAKASQAASTGGETGRPAGRWRWWRLWGVGP